MKPLIRIILVVGLFVCARSLSAQQTDTSTPPPPPPPAADAPATPSGPPIDPAEPPAPPPADAPAAPSTPAAPVFDPLHAGRSIDVGIFYMKKGNYDAAIDRFQEAARYQPKLARPWALLGETFEKKHDNAHAAEAYKKYLELYPDAPDAAKIQKRIATLDERPGQETTKRPAS